MRLVTITGTAQLTATVDRNIDNYETAFRRLFASDGWQIVNLDFQTNPYSFGFAIPFNVFIKAYVPDEYTNEQHLQQAFRRLTNYELCFPGNFGCASVITGVNLQISGEDKPGAKPPAPIKQPNARNNPRNNQTEPNANGLQPVQTPQFFDNLATGLGVSTPIAIGATVIIALLILRR
jgi:hypothetical protein